MVLVGLGLMWVLVLLPPWLRDRREGRPGSSITSFNRHLSTLGRTGGPEIGGPMPRPGGRPVVVGYRPAEYRAQAARERQRDVLAGLAIATVFCAGLGLGAGFPVFTFLGGVGSLALAAFEGLLLQEGQRRRLSSRVHRFPMSAPSVVRPAMRTGQDNYAGRRRA